MLGDRNVFGMFQDQREASVVCVGEPGRKSESHRKYGTGGSRQSDHVGPHKPSKGF